MPIAPAGTKEERARRVEQYGYMVQAGRTITFIPAQVDDDEFMRLTGVHGPRLADELKDPKGYAVEQRENTDEFLVRIAMFHDIYARSDGDPYMRLDEAIEKSSGPIKDKAAMEAYAASRREKYSFKPAKS